MANKLAITVVIDTREKTPLIFPANFSWTLGRGHKRYLVGVTTRHQKLETGDYLLAEWPSECVVERKSGAQELFKNLCTKDYARHSRAFRRLSYSCPHPILLVESDPVSFHQFAIREDAPYLLDYLHHDVRRWNIDLMWGGRHFSPARRRLLGEILLRRILSVVSSAKISAFGFDSPASNG